jgi:hypothetical protein
VKIKGAFTTKQSKQGTTPSLDIKKQLNLESLGTTKSTLTDSKGPNLFSPFNKKILHMDVFDEARKHEEEGALIKNEKDFISKIVKSNFGRKKKSFFEHIVATSSEKR